MKKDTKIDEVANQVVLLTTETPEGQYSATFFSDKTEAEEELNRMKKAEQVDHGWSLKNGFRNPEGIGHRVVTIGEALGLDGKLVWRVRQKCFLSGTYGQFDWANYFSTKQDALKLFQERAAIYKRMIEGQANISTKEDDEQLLILVDGKPVVYLDYLAAIVGEVNKVGTVMLPALLSAGKGDIFK